MKEKRLGDKTCVQRKHLTIFVRYVGTKVRQILYKSDENADGRRIFCLIFIRYGTLCRHVYGRHLMYSKSTFPKATIQSIKSISHRKKQPIWYGINLVLRRNCLVGSA